MSEFRNFVQDFPLRCHDVMKMIYFKAKKSDREVTLLFMVAAAAFIIPYERLKSEGHPSGDKERFKDAADKMASILGKPFLGNVFWEKNPASWSMGESKTIEGPPDSWPRFAERESPNTRTQSSEILAILRNALAHGNLYIRGSKGNICEIVFAAKKDHEKPELGFKFVSVNPSDFHDFLNRWFVYLEEQKLSQDAVMTALNEAA